MKILYTCDILTPWLNEIFQRHGHQLIVVSSFDDVIPFLKENHDIRVVLWRLEVDGDYLDDEDCKHLVAQVKAKFSTVMNAGYTSCPAVALQLREVGCEPVGNSEKIILNLPPKE